MFEDLLYLLRRNGLKVSLTEWMALMEGPLYGKTGGGTGGRRPSLPKNSKKVRPSHCQVSLFF